MKISVFDYLEGTEKYPAKPVCVVFGDDSFLRTQAVRLLRDSVLTVEDAEFSLNQLEGSEVTVKEVIAELRTVAMFGGDRRVVCINDLDEKKSFVSKNRTELEKYVAHPSSQAVLILHLKSFPSTTVLYKKLVDMGLLIEVNAKSDKDMPHWVVQWSKHHHQTLCEPTAARMIVDRIGLEHGLLDQELAKLALMVSDTKKGITPELVEKTVGSWRDRTVFDMWDLVLAGKTAEAVRLLDTLVSKEGKKMSVEKETIGILAPISSTLQKFAAATQLVLDAERHNRKISVRDALKRAGVTYYLDLRESQLKHLGRHRGAKLLDWLLQLDLDLKGDSRSDKRTLLEQFIVKLSTAK